MPGHQLEPQAPDAKVVRFDDLQQVDELLLCISRGPVEQLRGVAVNQVQNAEIALVTGGPAALPVSGTLLRR